MVLSHNGVFSNPTLSVFWISQHLQGLYGKVNNIKGLRLLRMGFTFSYSGGVFLCFRGKHDTKHDTNRKKFIKEYQDKKARITLWVEPELKAQLRAAADREGVSLTQYIINRLN